MWVEDSSFISNLVRLDEFVNIDVNLTNLTLKAILLVTEDRLRTNDLSLIKSVIIRS